MYITRNIEQTINRISSQFKVLLLTGARQVGKTTLLKHLAQNSNRTYVTLDDLAVRSLALSDPALFLQRYTPPLLIDEIQYAPQLLSYIKMYADNGAKNGDIWLTGSQRLPLMQGVTESLAGRVGIIDLQGLSANEINGTDNTDQFLPEVEQLFNRMNNAKKQSLKEIYKLIWQGSMPAMYNGGEQDWQSYYASYVQTFLQRDVMKLLQINDEMVFFRFLCAAAGQTGKMINYAELAKAAEISAPTAKQWIKTLEAAGIIYLLQPFMPPGAKYIVKAPKLYFFDTGLDQGLTTGTRPAIVGTGLQSHISRSACSLLACVVHGIDFGMGLTGLVMIPFSHHVSIRTYDDTSDERIGTCRPAGLFSKIQGHLHIFLISQICSPSLKKAMPSPRGDSTAFTVLWLHCLFSSRLYCRYWNLTNSCPKARGLYRRLGISPCPKDNSYEIASLL